MSYYRHRITHCRYGSMKTCSNIQTTIVYQPHNIPYIGVRHKSAFSNRNMLGYFIQGYVIGMPQSCTYGAKQYFFLLLLINTVYQPSKKLLLPKGTLNVYLEENIAFLFKWHIG